MVSPSLAWRTTRGAGDFVLQRDSGLMSSYGRDVMIVGVLATIFSVLMCLPSLRQAHVVRTYLGYVLSAAGIVGFRALLRYAAQTTHLNSLAVQSSLDSGFYERVAANWGVLLAILADIVIVGLGVTESLRETGLRRVPGLTLPTVATGFENE
jgi:hypothetical protein